MKEVNWKFRIPWKEICPKCKEILLQRKKEQERVSNRYFMMKFRAKKKSRSS